MSDDAEARKRRTAQLRKQIADLTGQPSADRPESGAQSGPGTPAAPDPAARRDAPRVRPSSPRSFVEERMRELDHGDETKH